MLIAFLAMFLQGSRFKAEAKKVICIEGKCLKPHDHGELNYHERFPVKGTDNYPFAVLKSCANFWEANATGMTFAVVIGAAALSLELFCAHLGRWLFGRLQRWLGPRGLRRADPEPAVGQ